ncbi:TIGR04255 family protein [Zobellella sp. DQSA1]|uniref:TIGR04255 family protein n=1 Tax=Zobellella sp. DQSA1 TaxID=3342386 RepID=UPI0035C0C969
MKKFLERSPLVHAVVHLRFSDVPSLEKMSEDNLSSIHSKMIEQGFPEKLKSKAEIIDIVFEHDSLHPKQNITTKNRYLFRASGEREIIEITGSSLLVKSSNYSNFDDFYHKFINVLKSCIEVFPEFNSALMKNVGVRYVNVIAPKGSRNLTDYMQEWLLPPCVKGMSDFNHLHGVAVKLFETGKDQVLRLQFDELKSHDGRVMKVLPDNLIERDKDCGLIISGQDSWMSVGGGTYGLLDVDHIHNFQASPVMNPDDIGRVIISLHDGAEKVFWSAISEVAKNEWGYSEG